VNPNLPKIADASVQAEKITGCPAELMAAQCILETGWLASDPQNNCFGIKWYKGAAGRQLLPSSEWFTNAEVAAFRALGDGRVAVTMDTPHTISGRSEYRVMDWFASFTTLGDCFAERAKMWDKGPYAKAATRYHADHDVAELVRGIGPIYATAPTYAKSVLDIMNMADVQMALNQARARAEVSA
jgi:flagellum-specific peptidoglycan hydrolase FlgJ